MQDTRPVLSIATNHSKGKSARLTFQTETAKTVKPCTLPAEKYNLLLRLRSLPF
jgi:hypothetical protein